MRTPGMSRMAQLLQIRHMGEAPVGDVAAVQLQEFQVGKAADDRHLVVRDGGLRQPEAAKPGLSRQPGHEPVRNP